MVLTAEVKTLPAHRFWIEFIQFYLRVCARVSQKELLILVLSVATDKVLANDAIDVIRLNLLELKDLPESLQGRELRNTLIKLDTLAEALPACFFKNILDELAMMQKRKNNFRALHQ